MPATICEGAPALVGVVHTRQRDTDTHIALTLHLCARTFTTIRDAQATTLIDLTTIHRITSLRPATGLLVADTIGASWLLIATRLVDHTTLTHIVNTLNKTYLIKNLQNPHDIGQHPKRSGADPHARTDLYLVKTVPGSIKSIMRQFCATSTVNSTEVRAGPVIKISGSGDRKRQKC